MNLHSSKEKRYLRAVMKTDRQDFNNKGLFRWLLQGFFLIAITFGATIATFGSPVTPASVELATPADNTLKRTVCFKHVVNRLHFLAVLSSRYDQQFLIKLNQERHFSLTLKENRQYHRPVTIQLLQKIPAVTSFDTEPAS